MIISFTEPLVNYINIRRQSDEMVCKHNYSKSHYFYGKAGTSMITYSLSANYSIQ